MLNIIRRLVRHSGHHAQNIQRRDYPTSLLGIPDLGILDVRYGRSWGSVRIPIYSDKVINVSPYFR